METYHTTRLLAERGHKISLVAFAQAQECGADAEPLRRYCDLHILPFEGRNSLPNLIRGVIEQTPVNFVKYRSRRMLQQCLALLEANHYDVLILEHAILGWYLGKIRSRFPIPVITRFHDVHTLIWDRWVNSQSNPVKRALGRLQRRFVARFERGLARASDLCLTIGAHDAEVLRASAPDANIRYLPAGFDIDRYAEIAAEPEPETILFLAGHYRWHPNLDAAKWLHDEILPLVWQRIPAAKALFSGKDAPAEMRAWSRDPRVALTGFLPDERPLIARGAVIVNPMRLGAGVKLKLLTAFASRRAVVSTAAGAEGLPEVVDGVHLLIRDTPADFAAAIADVLRNPALRCRLEENGHLFVRRHCGWQVLAARWEEALAAAIAPNAQALRPAPVPGKKEPRPRPRRASPAASSIREIVP